MKNTPLLHVPRFVLTQSSCSDFDQRDIILSRRKKDMIRMRFGVLVMIFSYIISVSHYKHLPVWEPGKSPALPDVSRDTFGPRDQRPLLYRGQSFLRPRLFVARRRWETKRQLCLIQSHVSWKASDQAWRYGAPGTLVGCDKPQQAAKRRRSAG